MFIDQESGDLSLMVPTNGMKKHPKIFIHIPPKCGSVHIAGQDQLADVLNRPDLLINNPTNLVDRINFRLHSNAKIAAELVAPPRKKSHPPNYGLILIDQPVDLDSPFGPTNGLPISFNQFTRDAILEFSRTHDHLLEASNVGRDLLTVCRL